MITTASTNPRVQHLVVLGGGTAGLLAAIAIRKKLPAEIQLTVIRSKKLGVIGVGEGTIPSVVQFLHSFLDLDPVRFHREAQPSIKLGIRYLWGPRPFFNYTFTGQLIRNHEWFSRAKGYYCDREFDFADISSALMNRDNVAVRRPDGKPRYDMNFSYHLENKSFVAFLETISDELGIVKLDEFVEHVEQDEGGVRRLQLSNGQTVEGDLYLDCSGFSSRLLGQTLGEPVFGFEKALLCDRAVVGGWERSDETYHPYTTAETMDAGWCWRIEHDEVINRGYVFSSAFLSDDEAIAEYLAKNPRIQSPRAIDFKPGVRRRAWVKNVVAIGNSVGFVEPLEATAIGMICDSILHIVKALKSSNYAPADIQRDIFNRTHYRNWEIIRDFLALHYRFNSRLETPFWQAARNDVEVGAAQEYVDYYRAIGPDFSLLTTDLKRDFFTAEGYLVMLLGQNVPHANPLPDNDQERQKWAMYKASLDETAKNGVPMAEYLEAARSGVLFESPGPRAAGARRRIGSSPNSGELNWH